jgi:hypothetical protein
LYISWSTWCVVRGAWCVVRGAWCVVRGVMLCEPRMVLPSLVVQVAQTTRTLNKIKRWNSVKSYDRHAFSTIKVASFRIHSSGRLMITSIILIFRHPQLICSLIIKPDRNTGRSSSCAHATDVSCRSCEEVRFTLAVSQQNCKAEDSVSVDSIAVQQRCVGYHQCSTVGLISSRELSFFWFVFDFGIHHVLKPTIRVVVLSLDVTCLFFSSFHHLSAVNDIML